MYQGNWTCSQCGGTITELPFEPKSEKGLTCRTCWSKSKEQSTAPATDAATPESVSAPDDIPDDAGLAGEPMPDDGFGEAAQPVDPTQKPSFSGDWQCSICGTSITSLPFNPRSTENLKCLDCFKSGK